ncbi:MAG: hypothetical protein KJ964_11215 [Verrucomicrobia bacterium]|nr:hypothetical protein [Verrucomicrobiota bacterium]MBU1735867.1 hypothetical protein [Verrucomicrobiota bacterium]MBU1855946.1 hypothetical protein [Verrucomicrobiota bacterium]
MTLLSWSSFPVFVLALFVVIEALPFWRRGLRVSRWWIAIAWFGRPWAVWAVFNIFYRIFASRGFNNRRTFPFYYNLWDEKVTLAGTIRRLVPSPDFWIWTLVVAVLIVLFWLVCRWVMSGAAAPRKTALALSAMVVLGFLLPLAFDCLPAGMADPWQKKGSFGYMWVDSGNTMLYCLPLVKNQGDYFRRFEEIQPELKVSIHGADHPPASALALYWLGKLFGAHKDIYRDWRRYELATAAFASLSLVAMFFLGWSMFRSVETGLMGAALWAVKPATLAYNSFAPDTVYWVFYILCFAFSWRVVMADKRPWLDMVGLGLVLYALTLLNFNWPMPAGIFGLFLLIRAYREKIPFKEWMLRGAMPLAIMTGLLVGTCLYYRLNYFKIFIYALKCFSYYNLNTAYKWMAALIGGQLDLYLMSGSLCSYLLWTRIPGWLRQKPLVPQVLFGAVILGCSLVAVLVLKDLKLETARIWAWIPAVPLVLVANYMRSLEHPRFYFLMAVVLPLVQYYVMRLVMVSAG